MIYQVIRRNRYKDYREEMDFRDDLSARRFAQCNIRCVRVERKGTVIWRRVPNEAEAMSELNRWFQT